MLDQYFRTKDLHNNIQNNQDGNDENEEDCCVNNKYIMSDHLNQESNPEMSNLIKRKDPNQGEAMMSIQQLETMKMSNGPSNDNSMDHYIQMENAYLKDGQCPINQTEERPQVLPSNYSNNEEAANEEIEDEEEGEDDDQYENELNQQYKINNPTDSNDHDYLTQKDIKLKRLQDKMQRKMDNEYNSKIVQQEKEIQKQAKQQLNNELSQYKEQIESQLEKEKKLHETNMNMEWNQKYDQMLAECKQKLRDEKEVKLTRLMQDKLRPQVEKEIYKKEYDSIVAKIKEEIEGQISKEIEEKKKEEMNYMKKKMEYVSKVKMDEIERNVHQKCKEEMEKELQREISIKESEYKLKYMQKYELYKNNLEKKLSKEYEEKKKEVKKEADEIKAKLYRSKCSEKLKINRINKIKKNITDYQRKNMQNSQQVEKIINTRDIEDDNNNYYKDEPEMYNDQIPNYDTHNDNNMNENYNPNQPQYQYDTERKSSFNNPNQNNPSDHSVNLAEINRKLRNDLSKGTLETKERAQMTFLSKKQSSFTGLLPNTNNTMTSTSQMNIKPNINTNSNSNLNVNMIQGNNNTVPMSNINTICLSQNSIPISPETKVDNNNTSLVNPGTNNQKSRQLEISLTSSIPQSKIITKYAYKQIQNMSESSLQQQQQADFQQNNPVMKHIFYSIQLDPSIPTTFAEFGKYLISHIEKEENYRLLFQSELKKIKTQIKKIFTNEGKNDHCLTDYMLELWNKIEISYASRYSILKKVTKMTALEAYAFLDRETEFLTDYFQESEVIFKMIKSRESLKVKLQTKLNRNELLPEDQISLDELTANLIDKIKAFKSSYSSHEIIWKGLRYEWFMNYEKWFYEIRMNV